MFENKSTPTIILVALVLIAVTVPVITLVDNIEASGRIVSDVPQFLFYKGGFFLVAAIAIIAAAIIVIERRLKSIEKEKEKARNKYPELSNYIARARRENYSENDIKAELIDLGWPKDIVNLIMRK